MEDKAMIQPIWTPSPDRIAFSKITEFCIFLEKAGYGPFQNYDQLWAWSVEHVELFWSCLWNFNAIIGYKGDTVFKVYK